jgi:glycosyltransferase involved in cell wall biosynthesis
MKLETSDRAMLFPASSPLREARRALRVCYLIDDLGSGGTEGQLLSLIRHLDRDLIQPHLCLLRGQGQRSRSFEPDSCPVMRLGVGALRHPKTPGKFFGFARFLRRQRFDVLQTYFRDSTLFGMPAGRLAGVPAILGTRVNLAPPETRFQKWLLRFCTRRLAHAVVANSPMCRAAALEYDGATAQRVHVIENGVELDRYADIPPLPSDPRWRPQRIGLLANLRPVKDPATLIQAARIVVSRYPQTTFLLAGEGELRPSLEQLIERLELTDQVFLCGEVRDVPGFLGDIDIGVLCSLSEGSPNAILEYMAAGRAIVATAVGGTRHVIRDGVNGLLVPAAAPQLLADAILSLIDNPRQATVFGEANRNYMSQKQRADQRARRFESLYAAAGQAQPRLRTTD